jgi:hypothetical protein
MKTLANITLIITMLVIVTPAAAQTEGIIFAPSIHQDDMDVLLLHDLTEWLELTRPGGTHIFAVMNHSENVNGIFVSLAGISPTTPPPYQWQLENNQGESNVVWTGTLTRVGGRLELFTVDQLMAHVPKVANILPGPGGGADITFPWSVGSKMMYGTRGVHGGGFGFGIGLDFVGGNDLGSGVAGDVVYASSSGTITAVCRDSTSVGIKVEGGGNKIAYFHLADDASLAEGTTYSRGAPIGKLVHGSFNNTCGWADQQPTHYHVHWVVEAAGGRWQTEGYVLNTSTQVWTRGGENIKTGQYITGGGGTGGFDDPTGSGDPLVIVPGQTSSGGGASMWDYVVIGINTIYGTFKTWYSPTRITNNDNEQLWIITANMARTMIKDANIYLVNDAINVLPLAMCYGVMLWLEAIKWLAMGIFVVFNLVKDLKGLAIAS